MSGNPEIQALAELNSVNINVYDIIPSSNTLYRISSGLNTTQTIKLFYTDYHYDSIIQRDVWEDLQIYRRRYWNVKPKDFMKKDSKLIKRKMLNFQTIILQLQLMNYIGQYQNIEKLVVPQKSSLILNKNSIKKQNNASED